MVKITRNGIVNIVPKSSFNNFFKSQGWKLMEGEEISPSVTNYEKVVKDVEVVEDETSSDVENEVSDEEWDDVLDELVDDEIEKPISEMNKEELTAKAKKLGINPTNLTNKQLREAIKSSNK